MPQAIHRYNMESERSEEMCSGHRKTGRAQEQLAWELEVGRGGVEPTDTLSWVPGERATGS